MNKITIWWVLTIYSLASVVSAFISGGAGAVNLAAVSGVMIAVIFYTRRYVPEKRTLVSKGFTLICAAATVVSIILALVLSREGMLGNIISNVGSGICTIVLVLLADSKKLEFMEQCETKMFVIILAVCLLVLPSVMLMVSGIVSFILAIVIVIAFAGVMFSDLGSFMLSQKSSSPVFRDDKGYVHTNAYDRDKANESYRSDKE